MTLQTGTTNYTINLCYAIDVQYLSINQDVSHIQGGPN